MSGTRARDRSCSSTVRWPGGWPGPACRRPLAWAGEGPQEEAVLVRRDSTLPCAPFLFFFFPVSLLCPLLTANATLSLVSMTRDATDTEVVVCRDNEGRLLHIPMDSDIEVRPVVLPLGWGRGRALCRHGRYYFPLPLSASFPCC